MLLSQLKRSLREAVLPNVVIFACALVMVCCGRLALGLLEAGGDLPYIYATSGSGTILEQICEIFTGPSIVALVAIGGIIGGMIAALLASAGWRFARDVTADTRDGAADDGVESVRGGAQAAAGARGKAAGARGAIMPQFIAFALWMALATVLIVAVFALVFLGTLSDVQLSSVSSKLGGGGSGASPGFGLMLPLTLVMLWTLLLMGGALVFAAIGVARRARRGARAAAVFLVATTALVGVLLVFLSVALFTRFNVVSVDYSALNTWLGISIGANLAVTIGGLALSRLSLGRR